MGRIKRITREKGGVSKEAMYAAVCLVVNDGLSIRAAAKQLAVPLGTFHAYVKRAKSEGMNSMSFAPNYSVRAVFTEMEETLLRDYIVKASHHKYGLSSKESRKLAYEFAISNKKRIPRSWELNEIAGKDWLRQYLSRHKDLSLRKPEGTSLSRATSFNKHNVTAFFDNMTTVMGQYTFEAQDIYNCDETGCTTVQKVTNVRVIALKTARQVGQITSAERGQLVTVCCAINALGNSIPPFFILPRVHFKQQMLKGGPPGSHGACSTSGWMTADTFCLYLEHFLKHTKCSAEHPVLVILDNHESHISLKSLDFCKTHGIVLLTLPPHCSHRMQPLDLCVFGPFKQFYTQAANDWMLSNPGKAVSIHDIAQIVGVSYPLAFTPKNIKSGFCASGIYPLNSNIFTDEDYLAAYVTDRPQPVTTGPPSTNTTVGLTTNHDTIQSATNETIATISDDRPILQSATEAVATTSQDTVQSSSVLYSPEDLRPFPKAPARKTVAGRKRATTRILTSTPVKTALEQELKLRAENKKQKGAKKGNAKTQNAKCRTLSCKKLKLKDALAAIIDTSDTESEDSVDSKILSYNESHSSDDYDDYELETQNRNRDLHNENDTIQIDDFVIVRFGCGTKQTVMYVGQVVAIDEQKKRVKFLRRKRLTSFKFVFPDTEDVTDVDNCAVVCKLPDPVRSGGTKRAAIELSFSVDFSCYKNLR